MAGGRFISDLRGTLSKNLKNMGKKTRRFSWFSEYHDYLPRGRHAHERGTHDGFDTHAMTSDLNVKISRSPKDTVSTHSPRTQKPKRHSQHTRVFSAFFFF